MLSHTTLRECAVERERAVEREGGGLAQRLDGQRRRNRCNERLRSGAGKGLCSGAEITRHTNKILLAHPRAEEGGVLLVRID